MTTPLFTRCSAVRRRTLAKDLGCDVEAFATNALTITVRPEPQRVPSVALIATFGTGTVISVEPAYRDFVEANAPASHFRAFHEVFLRPFVEEGERRCDPLTARHAGLGFTPARRLRVNVPIGYRLAHEGRDFAEAHVASGRFTNAIAGADDPTGLDQFEWAIVLYNAAGKPAAVAGAFLRGQEVREIGVDVAREERGNGLATVVVRALAADILRQGKIPTYYCAPTNVRSHRVALASGFLPLHSLASVRRQAPPTASV